MEVDVIINHFGFLSDHQKAQYSQLYQLYEYWNKKINVISRKDIEFLYTRHVLHSLAIAKVFQFPEDSKVVDIGTGGGFPGIPLAIMFPLANFTLVDSIGKKINVVNEIINSLKLTNATAINTRVENLQFSFHYAVSRAVTDLPTMIGWLNGKLSLPPFSHRSNGLFALKGGDISIELKALGKMNFNRYEIYPISDFFDLPFFAEKKVVFVPFDK